MDQQAGSQVPSVYYCPKNYSCAFQANERRSSSVVIDFLLIDKAFWFITFFLSSTRVEASRGTRLANTGKAAACARMMTMLQKLQQLMQSMCWHTS